MKSTLNLLTALLLTSQVHLHAAASDLSKIASRSDLDTVIGATTDDALKEAITDHTAAILAAAEQHPHVEAVIRTIESAPGTFTKINTTPEALRKAAGGDLAVFETLTMVNTGILKGHAHASRDKKTDPYDAAFIEHLGQIPSLENLSVVVTTLEESSLDSILKLNRLKSLRIEKRFPNLESLNLIHARVLTDASAVHLLKLAKLKSIILNGPKMTAAWHGNLGSLPLESLSVSQGNTLPAAQAIAGAKSIPTLRQFALSGKTLTDADLTALTSMTQLESLSLGDIDLPDTRVPQLQAFDHLKSLTLVRYGKGYPDETQAKVKALLPKVEVNFVQ
jgi:hypothetical protein